MSGTIGCLLQSARSLERFVKATRGSGGEVLEAGEIRGELPPEGGNRALGLAAAGAFRMTRGRSAGGGYLLEFVDNEVAVVFGSQPGCHVPCGGGVPGGL